MMKKGYLCAVVTQDAANWPSLSAMANRGELGPAAPANPSTDGSRQGWSVDWRTPQANEAGARVETLYTKDGQPARPGERAYRKTPDGRMVLQSQTINQQVEKVQNWATPNAFCYQPPENTEQWTKRAEYQQTEKGVNLHKPIQTQVLHEVEKQWRTPSSSDGEGGVMEMREGCAGKYKLRDHAANGNKSAKLNPRWVETLQGVCMGWTSPSCPASVIKNWPKFVSGWCALTIEPTSFDSSATESCLPQQSELFASSGMNS